RTSTQPTAARGQVARDPTVRAICIKYSSQPGRIPNRFSEPSHRAWEPNRGKVSLYFKKAPEMGSSLLVLCDTVGHEGGTEAYLERTLPELSAKGVSVTIVARRVQVAGAFGIPSREIAWGS